MNKFHSGRSNIKPSILIVGVNSLLGSYFFNTFQAMGFSVFGTTRRLSQKKNPNIIYLDLSSDSRLPTLPACDFTILCAGVTSISYCEDHPLQTYRINVENTVRIANEMLGVGSRIIYFSSNAVFDGVIPHSKISDRTNPKTVYGNQKLKAECLLRQLEESVAIVRLSKVISPNMRLLQDWAKNLRSGRTIQPYSDLKLSPLGLYFIAKLMTKLLMERRSGLFQASAASEITYTQLAQQFTMRLGCDQSLINPISARQCANVYNPTYSTMDTSTLKSLGLEAPHWMEALEETR
jgi:dTDP-4-dehydrorhamnose reductase